MKAFIVSILMIVFLILVYFKQNVKGYPSKYVYVRFYCEVYEIKEAHNRQLNVYPKKDYYLQ